MPYAGLDVHKREVEAAVLDDYGAVVARARFPCTREALEAYARTQLTPAHRVALEATTNTWGVVAVLTPWVAEVVVSNPMRTRAIAEAKIKTDKIDATVLAQLLRCDYLPQVWTPDPATRELRHLTGRRATLVALRTAIKNRIQSLLHEVLQPVPMPRLFSAGGQAWLATVAVPPLARAAVDSECRLLAAVEAELTQLGAHLDRLGHADPRVRLLLTIPGVNVAVAQTVLAALGDIGRFRDGAHAASYLGLVPTVKQSADHCYHGPITKQGKGHVRWMLVQAAQHLDRHPGPLGVCFRRLAHKKNRNVAVVAIARKLVVIAWHMLRHTEPYRYADPHLTQGKLGRLRVAGRGARRQGGLPKGHPRPASYGSGRPTRAVPALDTVYVSEGLPPRAALPPGEARMLRAHALETYVDGLTRAHRIPKHTRRRGAPSPDDPPTSS